MAYFRNVTLNIEDFDTEEEYSRALLEQDRIQKILSNVDITDAHVARQLYEGFNEHPEMFRSRVGTEFMDVLRENSKDDNIPIESSVKEQPKDTQDEEMVDTLTPELMKEAEEANTLQTPSSDDEQLDDGEEEQQSLQEDEAQALWEQTDSEPQQQEEQSLQEDEAQALWEQTDSESQQQEEQSLQEDEAQALWEQTDSEPQQQEEQSLQKDEAQALSEQNDIESQEQEVQSVQQESQQQQSQMPIESQELDESKRLEKASNENNSDNDIIDSDSAQAMAIKEETELIKPDSEVLHMEKPKILKSSSSSDNGVNSNNNTENAVNKTTSNINKDSNKKAQRQVTKTKRPELTYIGLIKWSLIILPFVIICFPMAGAILSGLCALYAFIKVWGSYINDKMKPVDMLKSLLCIVLFPIGIIVSVFGIMKKIKYVYYNRKAILYGFIMYFIPVIFFCNVGLISSNNTVSLIFPIVNLFLNASLVGQIAIILDLMAVAIIIICMASSLTKNIANLIYDYIDKGMTQVQAIQFIICLPIVVLCMFKAFIDGKILYEDKIVK